MPKHCEIDTLNKYNINKRKYIKKKKIYENLSEDGRIMFYLTELYALATYYLQATLMLAIGFPLP